MYLKGNKVSEFKLILRQNILTRQNTANKVEKKTNWCLDFLFQYSDNKFNFSGCRLTKICV